MRKIFYNVWRSDDSRWTNYAPLLTEDGNPKPISQQAAIKACAELNAIHCVTKPFVVRSLNYKSKKIIPDFPLDPMLHILEAGHIQDRQRKRS